jgi:hypothetical protein
MHVYKGKCSGNLPGTLDNPGILDGRTNNNEYLAMISNSLMNKKMNTFSRNPDRNLEGLSAGIRRNLEGLSAGT